MRIQPILQKQEQTEPPQVAKTVKQRIGKVALAVEGETMTLEIAKGTVEKTKKLSGDVGVVVMDALLHQCIPQSLRQHVAFANKKRDRE